MKVNSIADTKPIIEPGENIIEFLREHTKELVLTTQQEPELNFEMACVSEDIGFSTENDDSEIFILDDRQATKDFLENELAFKNTLDDLLKFGVPLEVAKEGLVNGNSASQIQAAYLATTAF